MSMYRQSPIFSLVTKKLFQLTSCKKHVYVRLCLQQSCGGELELEAWPKHCRTFTHFRSVWGVREVLLSGPYLGSLYQVTQICAFSDPLCHPPISCALFNQAAKRTSPIYLCVPSFMNVPQLTKAMAKIKLFDSKTALQFVFGH